MKDPRKAVIRRLAARHDHFVTEEETLMACGRYAEAQGAHEYALWILRAYRAELDDPEPTLAKRRAP